MGWYEFKRKMETKIAANRGDAFAQAYLGLMYFLEKDYQEAVKWYRLAAEQGNEDAQLNLGNMYAQGQGVPQDYKEALRWWQQAAAQGNVQARTSIQFHEGIQKRSQD